MCGIVGFIPFQKHQKPATVQDTVQSMCTSIHHRGPDDSGIYINDKKSVGLGFQRLAILDLSPNGAQPMTSRSERFTIVFNGEIYNFQDLRQRLEANGYIFKGGSDTEVLLNAIEQWGVQETLSRLSGMFAFALLDHKEQTITLARDPLGKKPLYLGWGQNGFYFASELKAVHAVEKGHISINHEVAKLYSYWRYVPDPYTIYQDFWKLKPGCFIQQPIHALQRPFDLVSSMQEYWQVLDDQSGRDMYTGTYKEAKEIIMDLLQQSVSKRMIADVPLGGFLSGGIDSSLIAAMMQKNAGEQNIQTFTIGSDNPNYNEADHARQIAAHIGSNHHEMIVSEQDALHTVEHVQTLMDEPFGDPSIIPTYYVCKLARQHMTVALSGDGGDELFGGYGWYHRAQKVQSLPLKAIIAFCLRYSPQQKKMAAILKSSAKPHQLYAALHSYAHVIGDELYADNSAETLLPLPHDQLHYDDNHRSLMGFDMKMFMTGDVLTKVDRASMANSLEVRNPLLDKDLVEFVQTLPASMRMNKMMLKDILADFVPSSLFERPKKGFSIPHGEWMRSALLDICEEYFSPQNIEQSGLYNPSTITKIWAQHKSAQHDYGHLLWTVLMFQLWHKEWV